MKEMYTITELEIKSSGSGSSLETPRFLSEWEADLNLSFTTAQRRNPTVCPQSVYCQHLPGEWIQNPVHMVQDTPVTSQDVPPGSIHLLVLQQSSMLHIFWFCPKLIVFWILVRTTIRSLTGTDLKDCPSTYLLRNTYWPIAKYKCSLTKQLLYCHTFLPSSTLKTTDPPTKGALTLCNCCQVFTDSSPSSRKSFSVKD